MLNSKHSNANYFNLLKIALLVEAKNQEEYLELIELTKIELLASVNQFFVYAKYHYRLIPLIVHNLCKYNLFQEVEKSTKDFLLNEYKKSSIKQLAIKKQLVEVINIFANNNVPIILLKGTAFTHLLYPENNCRLSNDVDVLVKKCDWEIANQLLSQIMNYSKKPMSGVFEDAYEVTFKPKLKIGIEVDLHKGLVHENLFLIDEKLLWQKSIQHPHYKNDLIRTLSPEFTLLHQAVHAFKDMNFSKYNLVDTHLIILKLQPNFTDLFLLAKQVGAQKVLYFLLMNMCTYIKPNVVVTDLTPIKPHKVSCWLASRLLASNHKQPFGNKKTLRYRLHQITSQFVFLDSWKLAFLFQFSYLKTIVRK